MCLHPMCRNSCRWRCKNNLYFNDLLPERFGRTREVCAGENLGRPTSVKTWNRWSGDGRRIHARPNESSSNWVIRKRRLQKDLPYIITDVLRHDAIENKIKLLNYSLSLTQGLKPVASLKIEIEGKTYEETASG